MKFDLIVSEKKLRVSLYPLEDEGFEWRATGDGIVLSNTLEDNGDNLIQSLKDQIKGMLDVS
jgi:hypothetical protein